MTTREELVELAQEISAEGYTVYLNPAKYPGLNWLIVTRDNVNFATVQRDYFGMTSVQMPIKRSKEYGTALLLYGRDYEEKGFWGALREATEPQATNWLGTFANDGYRDEKVEA